MGAISSEYAYVYSTSDQVVPLEGDVVFNSNGPTSTIGHIPGTSGITIVNAGLYLVTFSLSVVEPNQFAVFQNGFPVNNSTYGSGAGTQQNTGHVLMFCSPGDVITLRNHTSSSAVTLQVFAGGTRANVNASMTLVKISNPPL